MNTHKITLMGILTAGAIVISILESFIPSVGVPGVKLGLANIVILIILYEIGVKEAILVDLCRVFLVGLLRGTLISMGFLMSLSGAVLSLGIMILLYLIVKKFSIVGVSVIGSVLHVTGQIAIAMAFLGTVYVVYYLPIIMISAIITGVFVGFVSKLVIKTGAIKKQREKYNF